MQPALNSAEPTQAGNSGAGGDDAAQYLSVEKLKRLAHYDPETGEFTWLVDRGRVKAGTKAKRGRTPYVELRIEGKLYLGHRLAWFYMTGEWPIRVDHEDTDKSNNRWSNLREATHKQNLCNRGKNKNNTTGYKGVCRLKSGLFKANIKEDGKTKHLGVFDDPVVAHAAYCAAAARLHGDFARTE
jgi:hypothetical protein